MSDHDDVFQLIYTSQARTSLTVDDLAEIERVAMAKNVGSQVTGILAYGSGHFLQLLEGDEDAVETTYARIEQDGRHRKLEVLAFERVDRRIFSPWSMRLANLDDESLEIQDAIMRRFPSDRGAFPSDRRLAFAFLYALRFVLVSEDEPEMFGLADI